MTSRKQAVGSYLDPFGIIFLNVQAECSDNLPKVFEKYILKTASKKLTLLVLFSREMWLNNLAVPTEKISNLLNNKKAYDQVIKHNL